MIQARKLGHVVLKVRDAGKSRDFYVKTLGLKVAHEDLTRGAVFLSFGTEHHDLAVFQMASGETPAASRSCATPIASCRRWACPSNPRSSTT
jgi:catechol-2,3-dioxygenase